MCATTTVLEVKRNPEPATAALRDREERFSPTNTLREQPKPHCSGERERVGGLESLLT